MGSTNARPDTDPSPGTCDGKSLVFHQARARAIIKKAFSPDRLPTHHPAKRSERNAWQAHRRCIRVRTTRRQIGHYVDRMAGRYARKREADWCSPDPAPDGGGCWEIPVACVMAESGGSWTAQNPGSPARGPYQLLSHGEPWPVTTRAQAMEHHRIAEDLRASQGMSPWVAPAC